MSNDKGLAKTNWVKVIGSPVASTNQIFIEYVLYVAIKIIKSIKLKSGIINKNGNISDAGNYRPVSLATIISKLFEHYILS